MFSSHLSRNIYLSVQQNVAYPNKFSFMLFASWNRIVWTGDSFIWSLITGLWTGCKGSSFSVPLPVRKQMSFQIRKKLDNPRGWSLGSEITSSSSQSGWSRSGMIVRQLMWREAFPWRRLIWKVTALCSSERECGVSMGWSIISLWYVRKEINSFLQLVR